MLNITLNIYYSLDCKLRRDGYRCNWGYASAFSTVVKVVWADYLFFKRWAASDTFWRKTKHISAHSRIMSGSSLAVSFLVQYPQTVQYWNPLKRSFSSFEWHSGHLFKKRVWPGFFLSSAICFLVVSCIVTTSSWFFADIVFIMLYIYIPAG